MPRAFIRINTVYTLTPSKNFPHPPSLDILYVLLHKTPVEPGGHVLGVTSLSQFQSAAQGGGGTPTTPLQIHLRITTDACLKAYSKLSLTWSHAAIAYPTHPARNRLEHGAPENIKLIFNTQ